MSVDRIESIEAFSISLPRDTAAVTGTAGSPTALAASRFDYRWSETNNALYSVNFEAVLVKVTLTSGLAGWGEAQAPLAPDVACLIIHQLLRPAVVGQEFDGSPTTVESLRERMYSTMRIRGQTGGFMLDAIAGVDIALWDLAGKACSTPVADLLASSGTPRRVPCYLSGLPGPTNSDRVERAREAWNAGFRIFKLFHDRTDDELFDLLDRLRGTLGPEASIAVDALWRLDGSTAGDFGRRLDKRDALWLECPLPPESPTDHARLAAEIRTPIALGESYRSRHELAPFLACRCAQWLQPDLGRWGITEAARLARDTSSSVQIVPHISIAMGPQIAAALHFSVSASSVKLAEYNPAVFSVANRFLGQPLAVEGAQYSLPTGPGLGIDLDESAVRAVARTATDGPLAPGQGLRLGKV